MQYHTIKSCDELLIISRIRQELILKKIKMFQLNQSYQNNSNARLFEFQFNEKNDLISNFTS